MKDEREITLSVPSLVIGITLPDKRIKTHYRDEDKKDEIDVDKLISTIDELTGRLSLVSALLKTANTMKQLNLETHEETFKEGRRHLEEAGCYNCTCEDCFPSLIRHIVNQNPN